MATLFDPSFSRKLRRVSKIISVQPSFTSCETFIPLDLPLATGEGVCNLGWELLAGGENAVWLDPPGFGWGLVKEIICS